MKSARRGSIAYHKNREMQANRRRWTALADGIFKGLAQACRLASDRHRRPVPTGSEDSLAPCRARHHRHIREPTKSLRPAKALVVA